MRRSGSSAVKTEGDGSAIGPPKTCVDMKKMQDSMTEKYKLFSELLVAATVANTVMCFKNLISVLFSSGGFERMKTELREDVSEHSSMSDVESDSDSPTEVNITNQYKRGTLNILILHMQVIN